jgi:hypothetical protein
MHTLTNHPGSAVPGGSRPWGAGHLQGAGSRA